MTEKQIINKAMKDFRETRAFAKKEGINLNSIFYIGERLTPMQIAIVKDLVYALSDLNADVGKEQADELIKEVFTSILTDVYMGAIKDALK